MTVNLDLANTATADPGSPGSAKAAITVNGAGSALHVGGSLHNTASGDLAQADIDVINGGVLTVSQDLHNTANGAGAFAGIVVSGAGSTLTVHGNLMNSEGNGGQKAGGRGWGAAGGRR